MLNPDYFNGKEDTLLELYYQLEDDVLRDISRRLLSAGEMTGTADRELWKIEQAGQSKAYIFKRIQAISGKAKKELLSILQDAVMTSWKDDAEALNEIAERKASTGAAGQAGATMRETVGIETGEVATAEATAGASGEAAKTAAETVGSATGSAATGGALKSPLENENVKTVLEAECKKTVGELENLTRTTMDESQRDLINLLNEAEMKTASGTYSYDQAVRDVLDAYAGKGTVVTYPTGTRRSLEAAVRCCVVTSANQTAAQVTNQYILEAGAEYVLVSAHLGARTGDDPISSHETWQGGVYKIDGEDDDAPNLLESTGYDINLKTGSGTVVDPRGLHGYNCRHSHKPWDKDLRNPYVDKNGNSKIDTEENRKAYELSQRQRAMERAIRKTKRQKLVKEEELKAASDADKESVQAEHDRLDKKLTDQNATYNNFCTNNKLTPQYERTRISGE